MEVETTPNMNPGFLYHYTSFETLALILTNRTICFNSLQNVDDMEEAETEDMSNLGKFVYVSCWTDDPVESISLWNLYTPNMQGVRISLPSFPFKKYRYIKGQYFFSKDAETYINMENIYKENKCMIALDQPTLVKVKYTNDKKLLLPHIRSSSPSDAVARFLSAKNLKEAVGIDVSYSFEQIGRYKRTNWEFQHEWRYIIMMSPMGLQDYNPPTLDKQQEMISRIENPQTNPPYNRFFLELDDEAVNQMQIVFGPKMNEAQKIYVRALLENHGLSQNWQESNLRIR